MILLLHDLQKLRQLLKTQTQKDLNNSKLNMSCIYLSICKLCIPSYSWIFLYQVAFHLGWNIKQCQTSFKSTRIISKGWSIIYQQENMWFRRKVLVNRGSSDFLTLLLRAWKKHCNSRASISSGRARRALFYWIFFFFSEKQNLFLMATENMNERSSKELENISVSKQIEFKFITTHLIGPKEKISLGYFYKILEVVKILRSTYIFLNKLLPFLYLMMKRQVCI